MRGEIQEERRSTRERERERESANGSGKSGKSGSAQTDETTKEKKKKMNKERSSWRSEVDSVRQLPLYTVSHLIHETESPHT